MTTVVTPPEGPAVTAAREAAQQPTASQRWAAEQAKPVTPATVEAARARDEAARDQHSMQILREHYGSDEAVGKAAQDAAYTRQALGISDDALAKDGRPWHEFVIEGASMAKGLRMTAGLTPVEADEERRRLMKTPGFLEQMQADPEVAARWRGLVLRAGLAHRR